MNNYMRFRQLCYKLNSTLGLLSDIERSNIVQSYCNQGQISYRQYEVLLRCIKTHMFIPFSLIDMYSER